MRQSRDLAVVIPKSWNELVQIAGMFGVPLSEDMRTLYNGDIYRAIHEVGLGLKQAVRGMYQARWFIGYGLCVAEKGWEAYQLQIALDRLGQWDTLKQEALNILPLIRSEPSAKELFDESVDLFMRQARQWAFVAQVLFAEQWTQVLNDTRAEITFNAWVRDTVGLDVEYTTYRGWMAAASRTLFEDSQGRTWLEGHGVTVQDVVNGVGIDKMLRVLPHLDDARVRDSEEVIEAVIGDTPVHKILDVVRDAQRVEQKPENVEPEKPQRSVFYIERQRRVIVRMGDIDDVVLTFGKPVTSTGGDIVRELLFDLQDRWGMTKTVGENGDE